MIQIYSELGIKNQPQLPIITQPDQDPLHYSKNE